MGKTASLYWDWSVVPVALFCRGSLPYCLKMPSISLFKYKESIRDFQCCYNWYFSGQDTFTEKLSIVVNLGHMLNHNHSYYSIVICYSHDILAIFVFSFRTHISTSISAAIWETSNHLYRPSPQDNFHDGLRSDMLGPGVYGIQLSVWFTGCLWTGPSALGLIGICPDRRCSVELLHNNSVILYTQIDQFHKF